MKKALKELLTSRGYEEVDFKECIYDMENYEDIIAYNFRAVKNKEESLISIEVYDDNLTIWRSLDGDFDSEDWEWVEDIEK